MENMEKVVYLDNAATTPCAPEALEMMVKALSGACGNPSSHYSVGYEAKEFVDTGRAPGYLPGHEAGAGGKGHQCKSG